MFSFLGKKGVSKEITKDKIDSLRKELEGSKGERDLEELAVKMSQYVEGGSNSSKQDQGMLRKKKQQRVIMEDKIKVNLDENTIAVPQPKVSQQTCVMK